MNESTRQSVPNCPTPTFGNPDIPPEGRVNATGNPESPPGDGPHNPVIESQFPSQMGSSCDRCQHAAVLLVFLQPLAEAYT